MRKKESISILVLFVVILLFPNASRAAAIVNAPDPTDIAVAAFSLQWISEADSWGEGICRAIIDPENIEQFQIDFQFNPAVLQFRQIDYISPYTQTTLPDLSQLNLGLIQDIAGIASPAPSGEVDIFSIIFDPLIPLPFIVEGTVYASNNDFVVTVDPDTGFKNTLGPENIIPITTACICNIPEPATVSIFSFGLIFFVGVFRKKHL